MAPDAHNRGMFFRAAAAPLLLVVLAIAAGLGVGCGSTARAVEAPRRVAAPIETAAPIVAGARRGYELYSWLAEDRDGSVDRVIAELGLSPMAAEEGGVGGGLEAWGGSGLAVYRIQTGELDALIGGLPALSGLQRRWLGERASWTELVRGREEGGPRLVRVHGGASGGGSGGGVVRIDGAPVRLISRGWVEPARDGAELSLELAVQVLERSRRGGELFQVPGASRSVADEGWVPGWMSGSARLRDGEVLLIVAGAPDGAGLILETEEGAGAATDATIDAGDERATLDAMLAALGPDGGDGAYGPSGAQTQSIGVAAFTGRTARGTTVRTVVAVIARTPVRYTIPER